MPGSISIFLEADVSVIGVAYFISWWHKYTYVQFILCARIVIPVFTEFELSKKDAELQFE